MYQTNNTLSVLVFNSSSSNSTIKEEYLQYDSYSCGFYVAKTIIDCLGTAETHTLKQRMRIDRWNGTSQTKLISTLRKSGVSCSIYKNLNGDNIKKHLTKGKYIIVYNHDEDHWMILYDVSKFGMYKIYDPQSRVFYVTLSWVQSKLETYGIVCSKN